MCSVSQKVNLVFSFLLLLLWENAKAREGEKAIIFRWIEVIRKLITTIYHLLLLKIFRNENDLASAVLCCSFFLLRFVFVVSAYFGVWAIVCRKLALSNSPLHSHLHLHLKRMSCQTVGQCVLTNCFLFVSFHVCCTQVNTNDFMSTQSEWFVFLLNLKLVFLSVLWMKSNFNSMQTMYTAHCC